MGNRIRRLLLDPARRFSDRTADMALPGLHHRGHRRPNDADRLPVEFNLADRNRSSGPVDYGQPRPGPADAASAPVIRYVNGQRTPGFQNPAHALHGFEFLEQRLLTVTDNASRITTSQGTTKIQVLRRSNRLAARSPTFIPTEKAMDHCGHATREPAATSDLHHTVVSASPATLSCASNIGMNPVRVRKGREAKAEGGESKHKNSSSELNPLRQGITLSSHDMDRLSIEADRTSSPKRVRLRKLPHPVPSEEYMRQANGRPRMLSHARKLLVILDLNGVLIFRGRGRNSFSPRPGLEPFLAYLFANHYVMIWSSCMQKRVDSISARLLTLDQRASLVAGWGRESLRLGKHSADDVQVYKQLQWVWDTVDESVYGSEGAWDQSSTVLIEDDATKGAAQPFNTLLVDEYSGPVKAPGDATLTGLTRYISELARSSDVSQYMRERPFAIRMDEEEDEDDERSIA